MLLVLSLSSLSTLHPPAAGASSCAGRCTEKDGRESGPNVVIVIVVVVVAVFVFINVGQEGGRIVQAGRGAEEGELIQRRGAAECCCCCGWY